MIAANETVATALSTAKRSGLRRVVKNPDRWQRIVDLVHTASANLPQPVTLPAQPDAKALNDFLCAERERDPDHYPDLALAIIKLMGAGEYVLARGDDTNPPGHFALAAQDYAHSTAPNRRFADLVTQRVVHAMLTNAPAPYTDDELAAIAEHCNDRDKAARKVERAMLKRAQAQALSHNIGQHYKAIVTGSGPKGTFVRVLQPAVEGMLVHGGAGLDVGDRVNVTLVHTDVAKAFIDFARTDS
jgi:exoribonuclease-2